MFRFNRALFAGTLLWLAQVVAFAQNSHVSYQAGTQQAAQQELDRIRRVQLQQKASRQQYQAEQQIEYQPPSGQSCLAYNKVVLVGATLVDIAGLLPQSGECLNADRLNRLSRDITKAYLKHGYIYQSFEFEPQGQVLYLRIKEGRVKSISGGNAIVNPRMLFPGLQGEPLSIHRLDQGLDHTNKFFSNKVTVDVLPQPDGDIDVVLNDQSTGRVGGYVGLDNSGSKGTGEWMARTGWMIDSPFSLSDSLMFSASHSIKNRRFDPYSRSLAFQYSVPYGYWDFTLYGSISQYRNRLQVNSNQYELDGRTWQAGARVNYVFSRGANYISSLYGQLERISARGRFEKSIISLHSPNITNVQLGWSHLQVLPSGLIVGDIAIEHGLPWVKGYENEYNRSYRKINLSVAAQWRHRAGETTWRHDHELNVQYSPDFLPAIKQLELLDKYAIRGLSQYSASGEKGAVFRNNIYLSFQHGDWTIEPYVGFDVGVLKSTVSGINQRNWGHSWSAGLKLKYLESVDTRVEFSKGRFNDDQKLLSGHSLTLKLMYWF